MIIGSAGWIEGGAAVRSLDLTSILVVGLIATVVQTILMAVSRWAQLSRMSEPLLLGTALTSRRGRAHWIGLGVHLVAGLAFAVVYGFVFEVLGRTGWWIGALLGALHALFILAVVLPILPAVHPRVASEQQGPDPTRQLEPPGFLGLNYGKRTPLVSIVAHVAYGVVLGWLYSIGG